MKKGLRNILSVIFDRIKIMIFLLLPAGIYVTAQSKLRKGTFPNLKNPQTFNEKIQWLKLNWRDPILTICSDKWAVRSFVSERIGEQYLIDVLAVYDKVEKIDIDILPEQFVLKANHGSGWNVICMDKGEEDWEDNFRKLRKWLQKNYCFYNHEWGYKNIKPRIICERMLIDDNGGLPKDYKIFCFDGVPKYIQVDIDRQKNHRRNIYDAEWNLMPFEILYQEAWDTRIDPPKKLAEMLEVARKLSAGFCFVRVDLYYVQEQVRFGEMTFYHGSGYEPFRPSEYNRVFGDHIRLPKAEQKNRTSG